MHPEARRELLEAIDYYNDIEQGLGASFLAEIESAVASSAVFLMRSFTPQKPDVSSSSPSCTPAANPGIGLPSALEDKPAHAEEP